MNNNDFVIITENELRVSWLAKSLTDRGYSVLVGDESCVQPHAINILFYYSKILPASFLNTFSESILLNVHNSLLPHYRGLHAFSWAIEFGETDLGYTLHRVSAKVDAGEILSQTKFHLAPNCDVNCAFRIGQHVLAAWLPAVLEKLIRFGVTESTKPSTPNLNSSEVFKRRSGPYVLTSSFDMERLKNAVRASNPPYGKGLVFQQDEPSERIFLLPFSPECTKWVASQKSKLSVEVLQCTDGYIKVNSIIPDSWC